MKHIKQEILILKYLNNFFTSNPRFRLLQQTHAPKNAPIPSTPKSPTTIVLRFSVKRDLKPELKKEPVITIT